MSRILINEIDETTPELNEQLQNDVVFVPGFSSLDLDTNNNAAKVGVPTLCRTVAEFEEKFGSVPAFFLADQSYPGSFDVKSYASGDKMFLAGDPDPSYLYAKELLTSGIPVVYERLNEYGTVPPTASNYDVTVTNFYSKVSSEVFSDIYTAKGSIERATLDSPANIVFTQATYKTKTSGVPTNNLFSYGFFASYTVYEKNTAYAASTILKESSDPSIITDYYLVKTEIPKSNTKDLSELVESNYVVKYVTTRNQDDNTLPDPTWYLNGITAVDPGEYGLGLTSSVAAYNSEKSYMVGEIYFVETSGSYQYYLVLKAGTGATGNDVYQLFTDASSGMNELVAGIGCSYRVVSVINECPLLDKDSLRVKYLTTGGYPSFEYDRAKICQQMANVASTRGECIAVIDHTDYPGRDLLGMNSMFYQAQSILSNDLSAVQQGYTTLFTPWGNYSLSANYGVGVETSEGFAFPGSFAYFQCLAASIVSNPSWFAIAGATRGRVPHLISIRLNAPITNSIANAYQTETALSINPITYINPYGQCIWGNRTVLDNSIKRGTTALSFLNIRNMVCDIKKQLYISCQSLMFEQNTDILWDNFLFLTTPLLDKMVTGQGLKSYQIIKQKPSNKTTITAIIRIYPVYAVESFDITLYLSDTEVTVE